jgi:radical SAM enzyme (TIGR01210 family)
MTMNKELALQLLRSGKSAEWNAFRRKNPQWTPDLTNEDLSRIDFVPDGKQPFNLSEADIRGATLPSRDRLEALDRKVNLTGAKYDFNTKFAVDPIELDDFKAELMIESDLGLLSMKLIRVFISYASADRAQVDKYAQWLTHKGIDVRQDIRDFLPGEQISDEIAREMTECDTILVFFSTQSSVRPWPEFERKLAANLQQAAREKHQTMPMIIYLLLDNISLPAEQENRIAIHIAHRQFNDVCEEILRSLLSGPRHPRPHVLSGKMNPIPRDEFFRNPSYHALRSRIISYMQSLRRRMPQTMVDSSEPKDHEAWPDNFNGAETKRFIVYLRSSGCSWAIHVKDDQITLLPGCLDCEHSLAGSTFGKKIKSEEYVNQFERAIDGVDFSDHPVLCVYNEGNFYNEDELPAVARQAILQRIASIPEIHALIVESLPEYLRDEVMDETKQIIGPRTYEIGIGLESSNPTIRALCVNKSYSLETFESAVQRTKQYARVLAYVLLKPSFLTEREALEDAVETCRYAFSRGVDIVSIEPVNISNYNMSGELNRIGRYRPCWLWTVVEVAQRASMFGPVRLGGDQFSPKYYRHPFNCPKCNESFYNAFQKYNATCNIDHLTTLRCTCYRNWLQELETEYLPLGERIDLALSELETSRGARSMHKQIKNV